MREILVYEEYYITLQCNITNMWNFPLSSGPIVFDLGGPACLPQDEVASGAHMCLSLAARNRTMQGQLTDRIGVFRHRSAALFKYANRI
jgi:hypothetical protein